jgi:hypothetical protein
VLLPIASLLDEVFVSAETYLLHENSVHNARAILPGSSGLSCFRFRESKTKLQFVRRKCPAVPRHAARTIAIDVSGQALVSNPFPYLSHSKYGSAEQTWPVIKTGSIK